MLKYGLMSLTALALIACADGSNYSASSVAETSADFAAPAPQALRDAKTSAQTQNGSTTEAEAPGIFLAYRYAYGLVMPSKSVKATTDKHIQICRDAGPRLCQITGSNTNSYSDEDVRSNLSLRADPDWLVGFISGLKADVEDVDGNIQTETTSVEDLTRAILDTGARLKAKRTLRTRLENLLETRNAELPDLLTLEREIARVNGEIESATANLKALRARVSMSVVNISYTSERSAISSSSVSPIGAALKDFVSILSHTTGGVIRFAAFLLPLMLFVIIPGFLGIRWLWRRRKIAVPALEDITDSKTTE